VEADREKGQKVTQSEKMKAYWADRKAREAKEKEAPVVHDLEVHDMNHRQQAKMKEAEGANGPNLAEITMESAHGGEPPTTEKPEGEEEPAAIPTWTCPFCGEIKSIKDYAMSGARCPNMACPGFKGV